MSPKVILISLDGATASTTNSYLNNGVLSATTGLGLLKSKGAAAAANETINPSLTAPSHIAIATGSTSVKNDINANTFHLIKSPFAQNISGFGAPIGGYSASIDGAAESADPTAEPLWIDLRAAGKKVVTATFPGGDGIDVLLPGSSTILQSKDKRTVDYTVPFGAFGGISARGFGLNATNFTAATTTIATQLTTAGRTSFSPVRVATLETIPATGSGSLTGGGGPYNLQVAAIDTTNDSVVNYDTLVFFDANRGIVAPSTSLPSTGSAFIKASDKKSGTFYFEGSPNKIGTSFYVSNLAPDLSTVKIARYSANYIPRPTNNAPVVANVDDINNNVGFWAPQPDFRIPQRQSPGFTAFTDPELEEIYADQVRTFTDYQTRLALRSIQQNPNADLVMTYFEQPDGSGHQFLISDPRQATDFTNPNSIGAGQDQAKIARYQSYLQTAYKAASDAVQKIIDAVGVDANGVPRSNIIVTSDHGFAPFHTAVSINNILTSAGFDSSKVRAVSSGPAVNIYINLQGREPNGTVTPTEYLDLQKRVADTLKGLADTNPNYTLGAQGGVAVFDKVYTRTVPANPTTADIINARGDFIGQDSGDVFALLRVGYNFDGTQTPIVRRKDDPAATNPVFSVPSFYGAHGYDPTLPEMKAIFYAAGPDIGNNITLGTVRNIDIAPTISQLLGVKADAKVEGTPIKLTLATQLVGFAQLPADTFAAGPPSGASNISGNGKTGPFPGQPVQGFSGVQFAGDGTYYFMPDNGYGSKTNSADFLLRIYRTKPNFKGVGNGNGSVEVLDFIQLSDPNKLAPFKLVNDTTTERLLTGADLDIESLVVAKDGTFWIGDEFGPYLLHFDATGKLLEAPIATPNGSDFVRSPDHPDVLAGTAASNLPRSRGFEGMAIDPGKTKLYPMLEGTVTGDAVGTLRIYEYDIAAKKYTGQILKYQLANPNNAIGDFTPINDNEYLVIERDNNQGSQAQFKKIFAIDFTKKDPSGNVEKREIVNLLNIQDPNDLNGDGRTNFNFPFQTIEDVLVIDPNTILVANDNNYPFSSGRPPAADNNEIILLRLDQPLKVDPRVLGNLSKEAASYSNLTDAAPEFKFGGNGKLEGNAFRLTTPDNAPDGKTGSALLERQLRLSSDTNFEIKFNFKLESRAGDGFALVIKDRDAAIPGIAGGYLGYQRDTKGTAYKSIAVEFDTHQNIDADLQPGNSDKDGRWGDPNDNHIALLSNGSVTDALAVQSNLPFDLNGGQAINAWVQYDGFTKRLQVFMSQDGTKPATSLLSYDNLDLFATVGANAAIAFTGATGSYRNTQDILNISYNYSTPTKTTAAGGGNVTVTGYYERVLGDAGNNTLDARTGLGYNQLFGSGGDDTLYAGTNDQLFGDDGNDILFAGKGGSTLTGGAGTDTFRLAADGVFPSTAVTIADFQVGTDKLAIAGLAGVTTFSNLTVTQQGSDTLVSAIGTMLAVLTGIQTSSLNASSFTFS